MPLSKALTHFRKYLKILNRRRQFYCFQFNHTYYLVIYAETEDFSCVKAALYSTKRGVSLRPAGKGGDEGGAFVSPPLRTGSNSVTELTEKMSFLRANCM